MDYPVEHDYQEMHETEIYGQKTLEERVREKESVGCKLHAFTSISRIR